MGVVGFELPGKSPNVIRSTVHLEAEQVVHFHDTDIVADIAAMPGKETTRTARFKGDSDYPEDARGVRCRDFPRYFARNRNARVWPLGANRNTYL